MERLGVKIVVIGGGTGSFTLLSALKNYSRSITSVVNMADDGGSTGVLRDELGVLPPGDVRQCLVALSKSAKLRELFNYRFDEGTFAGHSFGNLFITALEKTTGNFGEAVKVASSILRVEGTILPCTLDNIRLKLEWANGTVIEKESAIDAAHFPQDPRNATLSVLPRAQVNPEVVRAVQEADIIVIAPGDLYTSLGPLLCVEGMGEALENSSAIKAYVCNLTTKQGQTDGFDVIDHVKEIERFAGSQFLNAVLYNDTEPNEELLARYQEEGSSMVQMQQAKESRYKFIAGDFLGEAATKEKSDTLAVTRGFIRHDSDKIARALMKLYFS